MRQPTILLSTLLAAILAAPALAQPQREKFTYTVRFATNQSGQPSSTCTTPMCMGLKALIDEATSTVDFAIYGLRGAPDIIAALKSAVDRGVTVRGVVDTQTGKCTADDANFLYSDTDDLVTALGTNRVHCDTSSHSYIMHHKFFIIDGAKVLMGTANVSDSGLVGEYNANAYVVFESAKLAAIYTDEFEEMFTEGLYHRAKLDDTVHELTNWKDKKTVVKSYFSPSDDARAVVLELIDGASSTLDVQMFFFTDQEIADRIVAAAGRGVAVRMVIDAGGGGSAYSKTGQLCDALIPVKTENWGSKQHNKWGVADAAVAGSGAVVVGSMNWTAAGHEKNDENTIYVKNDAFAQEFQGDFDAKWASLSAVTPCTWVAAEGNSSSTCTNGNCESDCTSGSCCDGADNDYDGMADAADNGCFDGGAVATAGFCEPAPGNPGAGGYGDGSTSLYTN